MANGIDLGSYGSRGQVRTALLSLKLAEVAWMREKTGTWPVLLLDEILAELDAKRRQDLLDYLADSEQTMMTTTDVNLFAPAFVEASTVWKIDGGRRLELKWGSLIFVFMIRKKPHRSNLCGFLLQFLRFFYPLDAWGSKVASRFLMRIAVAMIHSTEGKIRS